MMLFLIGFLACASSSSELIVLAPVGTEVPLNRLISDWGTSENVHTTVVFDDSHALSRMVNGGVRADIVILSDVREIGILRESGHLVPNTIFPLAGDDLAVFTSTIATSELSRPTDLLDTLGPIYLGPPESPEYRESKEWMEVSRLWEPLQPRLTALHSTEAVRSAVTTDPSAFGVLSAGAARLTPNATIHFVQEEPAPSLIFSAAVVTHAEAPREASALLGYLRSPQAEAPLRARGFRDATEHSPAPGSDTHLRPPRGEHRPPGKAPRTISPTSTPEPPQPPHQRPPK